MKENPPRKVTSNSSRVEQFLHEEAALAKVGVATNDLVRIVGRRLARVNGKFVKLGDHAFTVLVLLAELAVRFPGEYVSKDALLRAIHQSQRRLGSLGMSWVGPTPGDVYKAVCQIRAALKRGGLDKSVVELGYGQGYRLNTAPKNILIDPAMEISSGSPENTGTKDDNRLTR